MSLHSRRRRVEKIREPRKTAFTLVELLVVIGIIAMLISILLPALNKARSAANKVACASNMRQIGHAFTLYQNAYKGVMPGTDPNHPNAVAYGYSYGPDFAGMLLYEGYFGDYAGVAGTGAARIFRCPDDDVQRRPAEPAHWYDARSYYANRGHWSWLNGWIYPYAQKTIRVTQMKNPSDFIVLFERYDSSSVINFLGWCYYDYGNYSISKHDQKNIHSSNILFGDGHVAFVDGNELYNNQNMWSRSGVWEDLSAEW